MKRYHFFIKLIKIPTKLNKIQTEIILAKYLFYMLFFKRLQGNKIFGGSILIIEPRGNNFWEELTIQSCKYYHYNQGYKNRFFLKL